MVTENNDINSIIADINDTASKKTAGKVSFNTSSSSDYFSNESYKTLRTNMMFCSSDVNTIVITSCHENEGKSTVSSELAKSLAEIGKKTVLIDADLRKSVMLRRPSKDKEVFGLSELLSKQCDISQVIYSTQHPNFDVIFSGHFPPNPVELLGSGEFEKLLGELKKDYDYIIIDTPPIGAVIDAAVVASVCDGAIFVISQGTVSIREAQNAKEQLLKSGCKIIGAVMNDVERKQKQFYKRYKANSYGYDNTYNQKKK